MTTKSTSDTFFVFIVLLVMILLSGCLQGGTHGSIKDYAYETSKQNLQRAVENVIRKNRQIHRDTLKNYSIDVTNNRSDTIVDNSYNDSNTYVTIYIRTKEETNQYTFRYGGDKDYWDTSKKVDLFIAYAYNKDGNGGSDGHGGIEKDLKKRLLEPFEEEFIIKLDKELGQKHFEGN